MAQTMELVRGILIPFLGTCLGSACVFLMRGRLHVGVQRVLTGFAAGVMTAASIWSLLVPAMDQSYEMGRLAFVPAFVGFWIGILFLLLLDRLVPHLHQGSDVPEGPRATFKKTTMLLLAVTLHNIPEGMAVGICLRVLRQAAAELHLEVRWYYLWGSQCRIFRKARLFPCRCMHKGKGKGVRFCSVYFPVRWNRWRQHSPCWQQVPFCPFYRICSALLQVR